MKINKLSVPISTTATLAFVLTCALSCAKKNTVADNPLPAPPEPLPTNFAVADNTNRPPNGPDVNHPITIPTRADPPSTAAATPNPPPAETTAKVADSNVATL